MNHYGQDKAQWDLNLNSVIEWEISYLLMFIEISYWQRRWVYFQRGGRKTGRPICHHKVAGDLAESKGLSLNTAAAADDLVAADGGLGAVSSCWLSLVESLSINLSEDENQNLNIARTSGVQ